jgi:hypothetical protein
VDFYKADLFKEVAGFEWFRGEIYNKALIDPARSGAIEIIKWLTKFILNRKKATRIVICRVGKKITRKNITAKVKTVNNLFL